MSKSWAKQKRATDPAFAESERQRCRDWYAQNKDKRKEYDQARKPAVNARLKKRRQEDAYFRTVTNLRSYFRNVRDRRGGAKDDSVIDLLGCSVTELMEHLAWKFEKGMTWDNYGEWHIDHIIPCAFFDLDDQEQQKMCFHYTNLQPLWGTDNVRKSDTVYEHLI